MNNEVQITNQVLSTIKQRSSARAYSSEQLTDAELDTILRAGLMAPTATNRQELRFTVVRGDNPVLEELDEETDFLQMSMKRDRRSSLTIFIMRRRYSFSSAPRMASDGAR